MLRHTAFHYALFAAAFLVVPVRAGETPRASIVLTAQENGLEPQREFLCTNKIHGYIRLPARQTGTHLLEGIWTSPTGHVLQHSRNTVEFAPPGRSTAYIWLAFPGRPALGSLDPAADQERLSYTGAWQLDVRWDEQPILHSSFTVHCQ